jgi:hypothetical protein
VPSNVLGIAYDQANKQALELINNFTLITQQGQKVEEKKKENLASFTKVNKTITDL